MSRGLLHVRGTCLVVGISVMMEVRMLAQYVGGV